MFKKFRRKQDGFTLIELIVVVAILGILAVVLTPRVMDAVENARTNTELSNVKQIQLAMERYFTDKSTYPFYEGISDAEDMATEMASYLNMDPKPIKTITYETFDVDGKKIAAIKTKSKSYELTVTFGKTGNVYVVTPNSVE